MDEDDTVNHYEANYQFIFTWSMIRLVFSTVIHNLWRSITVFDSSDMTMPAFGLSGEN